MNYLGRGQWIQVDLRTPTRVVAVITQGLNYGGTAEHWVTSFKISYGNTTNSMQVMQNRNGSDNVSLECCFCFSLNSKMTSFVHNVIIADFIKCFLKIG